MKTRKQGFPILNFLYEKFFLFFTLSHTIIKAFLFLFFLALQKFLKVMKLVRGILDMVLSRLLRVIAWVFSDRYFFRVLSDGVLSWVLSPVFTELFFNRKKRAATFYNFNKTDSKNMKK